MRVVLGQFSGHDVPLLVGSWSGLVLCDRIIRSAGRPELLYGHINNGRIPSAPGARQIAEFAGRARYIVILAHKRLLQCFDLPRLDRSA